MDEESHHAAFAHSFFELRVIDCSSTVVLDVHSRDTQGLLAVLTLTNASAFKVVNNLGKDMGVPARKTAARCVIKRLEDWSLMDRMFPWVNVEGSALFNDGDCKLEETAVGVSPVTVGMHVQIYCALETNKHWDAVICCNMLGPRLIPGLGRPRREVAVLVGKTLLRDAPAIYPAMIDD
jgi:hypothetical protein